MLRKFTTLTRVRAEVPQEPGVITASLEFLDVGITIFDRELRLVYANRRFFQLRDIPQDLGAVGTRFDDQVRFRAARGDYGVGEVEAIVRAQVDLARRFQPRRVERTNPDGRVLEIQGNPLPGGGFVATYGDITERKRIEHELRAKEAELCRRVGEMEAAKVYLEDHGQEMAAMAESLAVSRAAAEASERAKSAFLAGMSHELRTPLNAIIGFSEIIEQERLGPLGVAKYSDYAKDVREAGQHLLDLINDVLDLSKIEAGKAELNEEEVEVREVADRALRMMRGAAKAGGLELRSDIPRDLPRLYADGRKLLQILTNLLSNAIKFTPSGGRVVVAAGRSPDGGFVFEVSDTGIGMAAEEIPTALASFGQIDGALHRRHDGTGLGLPISVALVEMHGGVFDLQSTPGGGTTVTLCLPPERVIARQPDGAAARL